MKAFLESSRETGNLSSIFASPCAETTITEEVRVFRAGIAQWAARYVERHDVIESADKGQKAAANLQGWSREYFRAMEGRGQGDAS